MGKTLMSFYRIFSRLIFEVERFDCLHYFYQGYLAAQAELQKK